MFIILTCDNVLVGQFPTYTALAQYFNSRGVAMTRAYAKGMVKRGFQFRVCFDLSIGFQVFRAFWSN